jgi:hypothetical protein
MNAERLHAIANAIREDLRITNSIQALQQLSEALQNQISSPVEPSYQTQVAEHLKTLTAALRAAPSNQFPPTWKQVLKELGAADLFGLALAERIEEIFSRNQITPVVAQEEIEEIMKRMSAFQNSIDEIRSAFSKLNIGAEELEPGTAELGVLVPRDFVENKLQEFAEELEELDGIFAVFAEVTTGSRPGFEIRSISSSDLSVFLALSTSVAACVAVAVERIVALYKQLLEIRKLHGELRDQGVPEKNLKGIEEHANTFMDKGIEEEVNSLLDDFYKNADGARKNELKIELRYSLSKIANRVDRGFNIEVRVEPPSQTDAEPDSQDDVKYAEMIKSAAPTLQFLKREGKPILSLPEEGEKKEEKREDKKK